MSKNNENNSHQLNDRIKLKILNDGQRRAGFNRNTNNNLLSNEKVHFAMPSADKDKKIMLYNGPYQFCFANGAFIKRDKSFSPNICYNDNNKSLQTPNGKNSLSDSRDCSKMSFSNRKNQHSISSSPKQDWQYLRQPHKRTSNSNSATPERLTSKRQTPPRVSLKSK